MVCEGGGCLRSAYYGTAKYGCSFYGLVMPLSDLDVTFGVQGTITNSFTNQGAIALTYEDQGTITIDFG